MKVNLKNVIVLFSLLLSHQLNSQTKEDSTGFKDAALNYINGWYSGNGAQMQSALHPMLNKLSKDEGVLTASGLVKLTNECLGCSTKDKIATIEILDMEKLDYLEFVHAVVKVESAGFMDYMFLTKAYGRYVITHVLWDYKNVSSTGSDSAMSAVAKEYVEAAIQKDSVKLFGNIINNFSNGQTKCYEVIEKIDKQWLKEHYKTWNEGFKAEDNLEYRIIDNYKGNLGVVKVSSPQKTEYIQLAFRNGKWKIYNVSRTYYTYLRSADIELLKNKIASNALAGSIVSGFDTRLHYEIDVKSYTLTTEKSDESFDNDNFKITSKKLSLAVNASEINNWPQTIRIRTITFFGDTVFQNFTLEKDEKTSVPENKKNLNAIVSPNPVNDYLEINATNDIVHMKIIDINGTVIYKRENVLKKKLEINMAEHKPGIYYVVLADQENQHTYKICKL